MKNIKYLFIVCAVMVLAGAGCSKKDAGTDTALVGGADAGAAMEKSDGLIEMEAEIDGGDGSGGSANDHFTKLFANFKDYNTLDFTADMIFRGGANDGTTMVMKRDAPDTHHMIITSPRDGTSEMIYANGKNYIKAPGESTWVVLPSVNIPEVVDLYTSDEKLQENFGDPSTAVYQGKKPCGALTCHVYDVVVEGGASTIAFDTKDFLIRTVSFTAESGDVTDITYTYGDVSVGVPTNVQEMELPGGMTQEDMQKMMEAAQAQVAQ